MDLTERSRFRGHERKRKREVEENERLKTTATRGGERKMEVFELIREAAGVINENRWIKLI